MSSNPTEKGGTPEMPVISPKCPHCGEDVPGFNVSTMILPTPQNPQGDITFMVPCCPLCNKIITAQFVGYTPHQQNVATPPKNIWSPNN